MISLNDRIYGLSLWSWILTTIVLIFFFVQIFSTNELNVINDTDDKETFKNSKNVKVYNFNTSWCGWSVKFQPEWKKLEDTVKNDMSLDNIQAFDIKCDNPENEAKCKEFEVQGFPTVIIEVDGKRGVYNGPRESDKIIETLKDL
jgi:protein disulfide-isomerase A1